MATVNTDGGLTLVLGGKGKTGRCVAERLRALGRPVRIGSRSATPSFDWDDRSTWGLALNGVSSADVAVAGEIALAPRDFADYVRRTAATGVSGG